MLYLIGFLTILVGSTTVSGFRANVASVPTSTATIQQRSFLSVPLFGESAQDQWNKEHVAHDVSEIHEETNAELHESEESAAWDAHDCPDAGMEAAAEERAVMLASEMMHKMKEEAQKPGSKSSTENRWNDEHIAHGASEIHEETNAELKESEDAAAWDAHDAPDAGMEAAAEERAVMLAAELVHKMKEDALQKKNQKN